LGKASFKYDTKETGKKVFKSKKRIVSDIENP